MLYLIPTPIAPVEVTDPAIVAAIEAADYFVVENVRTTRRYISSLKLGRAIDEIEFVELSEHTSPDEVDAILAPIVAGRVGAVMSEAGLPCVADPGNILVAAAHRAGVRVVPLIGASSIMLALMASGASGQNFAFNGYLPVKSDERVRAIKFFERRAVAEGQTQIFIETPYRNDALLGELVKCCESRLMLCVACGLTSSEEVVISRSIEAWRRVTLPSFNKRPAIFILFAQ